MASGAPGRSAFACPTPGSGLPTSRADGTHSEGDCRTGGIDHVLMRGPQVTPGYLDPRHDKGRGADHDGWLDSGDLGRLDADMLYQAHQAFKGISSSGVATTSIP